MGIIIITGIIAFLALEVWNFISCGSFLGRSLFYLIRGMKEINTPEGLQIPIANGLIKEESELRVGEKNEYAEGIQVSRFAISPAQSNHKKGTILTIKKIRKRSLLVKEVEAE